MTNPLTLVVSWLKGLRWSEPIRLLSSIAAVLTLVATTLASLLTNGDATTWPQLAAGFPVIMAEVLRRFVISPETARTQLNNDVAGTLAEQLIHAASFGLLQLTDANGAPIFIKQTPQGYVSEPADVPAPPDPTWPEGPPGDGHSPV